MTGRAPCSGTAGSRCATGTRWRAAWWRYVLDCGAAGAMRSYHWLLAEVRAAVQVEESEARPVAPGYRSRCRDPEGEY